MWTSGHTVKCQESTSTTQCLHNVRVSDLRPKFWEPKMRRCNKYTTKVAGTSGHAVKCLGSKWARPYKIIHAIYSAGTGKIRAKQATKGCTLFQRCLDSVKELSNWICENGPSQYSHPWSSPMIAYQLVPPLDLTMCCRPTVQHVTRRELPEGSVNTRADPDNLTFAQRRFQCY